ncbi:hypothetical protein [Shewanella halotolerans]|uniref:hypothetical protein n=1 Tax=Shewanella halotolerans TaxID=2864204 RepID=UPI001C655E5C|nr:hypothetical protein [Shewanella halotolerans]QYJ91683.1 hypothetical protein K0H81_08985 [Shewanella halotolerans]
MSQTLSQLLNQRPSAHPRALVVGNGINRYRPSSQRDEQVTSINAWDEMLLSLWRAHQGDEVASIPVGIALTEFYDALDLISSQPNKQLQKEFCSLMASWQPQRQHQRLIAWAAANNTPVLTTNFEQTLAKSHQLKLHHLQAKHFTDFYPWSSYFAKSPITSPTEEFAIWHINGMQRYARSVRLGLSHYMGAVDRARDILHQGHLGGGFKNALKEHWRGNSTWLNILLHNELVFIGLGLESNEIFLRWLLIERAKLYKAFPERRRAAYYIYAGEPISQGQALFLEAVGVTVLPQTDYEALYEAPWAERKGGYR